MSTLLAPVPLSVTPKPETQGNPSRERQREGQGSRHGRAPESGDAPAQGEHSAFLNAYGERIGATLHVTA